MCNIRTTQDTYGMGSMSGGIAFFMGTSRETTTPARILTNNRVVAATTDTVDGPVLGLISK